MNKAVSFYFDFLRVIAAFYVFVFHIGYVQIGDSLAFATKEYSEILGLTSRSAHYFVIVFFVLSGYLITMAASKPNMSLKNFLVSRLGRLYSVLLPALLLSILTAQFLISAGIFNKELILNNSNLIVRAILNCSFLAESWNLNATPPLNTPFWSVHYEFMYYLIIASCLLIKGKLKFFILAIVLMLAGIKILLLFPCWFVGSVLFFLFRNNKLIPTTLSFVIFGLTSALIILIISNVIYLPFEFFHSNNKLFGIDLFFSSNYIADYIFSFFIALNLYCFFGFSKIMLNWCNTKSFSKADAALKIVSNCSYTMYLFHIPLLFLFSSFWIYDKTNLSHQLGLIVIVSIAIYFIARQTEWKVDFWRNKVAVIINAIEGIYNRRFIKKNVKIID